MYQKILNDLSQEYYKKNFPNNGQRFIAWYLRNIHNLDIYETKDCITDGAGDKQIDAIYIDNQSCTIYIIQGKFYSGVSVDAEPLREVLSSWIQIKNLPKLQEGANDKLKIKINEMANAIDEDYTVCFELITTSILTESAQHDMDVFKKELSDSEELQASLLIVDNDTLKFKYEEAINQNRPYINHEFPLEDGKFMELTIKGTKAAIVVLPIKECIRIPGIKDGSLFRKNVRQSLGSNNKVNKGIASTIKKNPEEFFFLHNGITAICSSLTIQDKILSVKELNVVNGCQSLSTIFSFSEYAKKSTESYIMFKFYEISNTEKADIISTSTNNQSAVKARDLRSNDRYVLAMKKAYESFYESARGYFITKRGETVNSLKYNNAYTINLTDLGKWLIAWHSQRPTISYSETRIFDKYFDQLFHREYSPENIQALNAIFNALYKKWNIDNPMGLNETLLAMKAYAPYHHLYAISVIISELNKMNELVPNPAKSYEVLQNNNLLEKVIMMGGNCLNMAMSSALSEVTDDTKKLFVPQNWIKSKTSLNDIKTAIRNYLATLRIIPDGNQILASLVSGLSMDKEYFDARWAAD